MRVISRTGIVLVSAGHLQVTRALHESQSRNGRDSRLTASQCQKFYAMWNSEVDGYGKWRRASGESANRLYNPFPHRLVNIADIAFAIQGRLPHVDVVYRYGKYGIRGDIAILNLAANCNGDNHKQEAVKQAFEKLYDKYHRLASRRNRRIMAGKDKNKARWDVGKQVDKLLP